MVLYSTKKGSSAVTMSNLQQNPFWCYTEPFGFNLRNHFTKQRTIYAREWFYLNKIEPFIWLKNPWRTIFGKNVCLVAQANETINARNIRKCTQSSQSERGWACLSGKRVWKKQTPLFKRSSPSSQPSPSIFKWQLGATGASLTSSTPAPRNYPFFSRFFEDHFGWRSAGWLYFEHCCENVEYLGVFLRFVS